MQLLIIFFTEHRYVGLHDIEKFKYRCCHTAKETGTKFTFQNIRYRRRFQHKLLPHRIKAVVIRSKYYIGVLVLQLVTVTRQGAGISVKVVCRRKLQTVNKNACHHAIRFLLREPNQRHVALMQAAHGRDKGNRRFAFKAGTQG